MVESCTNQGDSSFTSHMINPKKLVKITIRLGYIRLILGFECVQSILPYHSEP
jgi:hypothetical protein